MTLLQVKAWRDIPQPNNVAMLDSRISSNGMSLRKKGQDIRFHRPSVKQAIERLEVSAAQIFHTKNVENQEEVKKHKHKHKQVLVPVGWDSLCDYWSTEKYKKKSATNALNQHSRS